MTSTVLALALAATTVSQSKLGVEVLGDDATSQALLAACPRLVVFPLGATNATAAAQIAAYKLACTGGKVIVQVGGQGLTVDATTASQWDTTWLGQVQQLNTSLVDGIEGPSEPVGATGNADLAAFWASFAQKASAVAMPVVGALPPRIPTGSPGAADEFCATVTAVRTAMTTNPFAWSFHARSATMTQDVATESSTTLAYRQIATDCGLAGTTLYLTEAGRATGPWQATDTSWLTWFDARLQENAFAQGAALVEAGGTGQPLDLAPVASALASYLANPASADGGVPDGGADGGNGAVVNPTGGPGGPLVNSKQHLGCSCGSPGLTALVLVPALLALRRRTRRHTQAT